MQSDSSLSIITNQIKRRETLRVSVERYAWGFVASHEIQNVVFGNVPRFQIGQPSHRSTTVAMMLFDPYATLIFFPQIGLLFGLSSVAPG